ncbi:MAG TPA: HAD family hydrolase [Phycisphaerae bacterium]|nr:HAD family hydrolase [Phycisphaerae bacterium]HOL27742.1 HAD family hydrolase [Phycisphaerae bacterium]HPP22672.1 HAD family hydrolase [Phycisphaerae bacterium]HPU34233.1 HAD family hydrolase [Phycisphaerae bacterium]
MNRVRFHLSQVRAIVFDLDDTLYPEQAYVFSGFDAVGEWLRARVACPIDPAARMRELFLAGERRHVFDRLLAELRHPASEQLISEMVRCYRTHVPHITLHEDARVALEAWRGRWRLGLLSDGPLVMQEKKVEALGIRPLLDEIILTDQWGPEYWKPHPRGFEVMENRLKTHGAAVVYIADNCSKDFVGPRRLGWRTVWVRRPGGVYCDVPPPVGGEPEMQIASLVELDR